MHEVNGMILDDAELLELAEHSDGLALVDSAPVPTYAELVEEIRRLRHEQSQILIVISDIRDKVGPALEKIQNSAIGKMFGMGE